MTCMIWIAIVINKNNIYESEFVGKLSVKKWKKYVIGSWGFSRRHKKNKPTTITTAPTAAANKKEGEKTTTSF